MKLIISIFLIALLSFTACLYFPWWSIAIVAFIVTVLIRQTPAAAFITGFISLFLLWGGLSFWISSNNHHILAHRVSLVILKIDRPYLLMMATALIGGLIAGFAALTGSYARQKRIGNRQ
jgi:hypothetical protein